MSKPKRCPKCQTILDERELPDSLPGIKHLVCGGCGYSQAITRRQPKERL